MYQAKTTGKARWVVYEPTMRASAVERLQLENDLGRAVEDGQLRLVYQPVVELATNRIVGFEALAALAAPRAGHDHARPLHPHRRGERDDHRRSGEWVLQTACHTAAGWRDAAPGRR